MGQSSHVVIPRKAVKAVQDDPEDNKILECALASDSDYIVTGDKHLLNLKSFADIPIIKPAEFLEVLRKSKTPRLRG